jgi:glutamate-1-semialdehyde 2,1-aminomutase
MTCLGKVVGGGMPLAVYGGQRRIMECIAPSGPVYQAGTLSGNPLAVSAGSTTLKALTPDVYTRLEALGRRLEEGIRGAIVRGKHDVCVQRVGSMLTVFMQPGPVRSWTDAARSDTARFGRFHASLLAQGVYWPPAQFEAAFISAAHDEAVIDRTIAAVGRALDA